MAKRPRKLLYVITSAVLVIILTILATWEIMNSRTFQFFGGLVNKVNTEEKVVALTFDDGPTAKTDQILSILKDENVKATFFLIGGEIEKYPDLARKIVTEGHQIGNHSYSHERMVFKSVNFIKKEIEDTDELIRSIGYEGQIQFRPPNGKKLMTLPYYLNQNHRNTIMWDIEPNTYEDVNKSSENIIAYVNDNIKPGSIILLHPMSDEKGTTIGAIKGIIESLRKKGYQFKTVNELLEMDIY